MASEKTVQPETLRYSADAGNAELSALCGPLDENLRQIETILNVRVSRRGDVFRVTGELEAARRAVTALAALMTRVKSTGEELSVDDIQWHFVGHDDEYRSGAASDPEGAVDDVDLKVRRRDLQGRTPNQRLYLKAIMGHDISFGVGPAGTGKTFLAVAAAVDAFERGTVERIVLTRPAVEAGASRLPARRPDAEGRSVPASALRRALRSDGLREVTAPHGAPVDRGGAARLHARPHTQQCVRHP